MPAPAPFVNHYATLSLFSVTDDLSRIKRAWQRACLAHHPDHGGSDERQAKVNAAWEILSDRSKRERFNEEYRRHFSIHSTPFGQRESHPYAQSRGDSPHAPININLSNDIPDSTQCYSSAKNPGPDAPSGGSTHLRPSTYGNPFGAPKFEAPIPNEERLKEKFFAAWNKVLKEEGMSLTERAAVRTALKGGESGPGQIINRTISTLKDCRRKDKE